MSIEKVNNMSIEKVNNMSIEKVNNMSTEKENNMSIEKENKISTEILPWEQQENEPDFEYRAFKKYLDYGPARSYRQTATIYSRNTRTISNWAKKWNWPSRLKDYQSWSADNFHSKNLELIKTLEMEKYEFKINQARLALQAASEMQRYFDNFKTSAANKNLKIEIEVLNNLTNTINMLLKSADFSMEKNLNYNSCENYPVQDKHMQEFLEHANEKFSNSEEGRELSDKILTFLAGE